MTCTATATVAEARAHAVAAAIAGDPALGDAAVDAHDVAAGRWQVIVYFTVAPDRGQRAALARHGRFAIAELQDTDWVAKSLEGLRPVRAGRFVIHGRHDRGAIRPNDIAIEIEAGQAFGTGHHGTTAGCLLAIAAVAKSRRVVRAIDAGTGTGVLAIAIARRTGARVMATDIDPLAVRIAADNAKANGVGARVRAAHTGGLAGRAFDLFGAADLIVANILAGPLTALAPAIRRRLAPGGTVILSGLLPDQRARIVATYRGVGLRLAGARVRDGWLTVRMERPGGRPVEARRGRH
jgi:ribosomal protein L11 methyltransferase